MNRLIVILLSLFALQANATGNLLSDIGFESGKVAPKDDILDGIAIGTLDNTGAYIWVGNGGAGPETALDTKVVPGENVVKSGYASDSVVPRLGSYFLRSAIYYDKNYLAVNNSTNPYNDKPRSIIYINKALAYDKEYWIAMSIYLPKSWEQETATKGGPGGTQVLSINPSPSSSTFTITIMTPTGGTENHWYAEYQVNAQSVDESDVNTVFTAVDMGPVSGDLGKWVDIVIRLRVNPFTTTTNPAASGIANAVNASFSGNKGILQVWKSTAETGLQADYTQYVNVVNAPVGLVPWAGKTITVNPRVYKYGWKRNPTNVTGPIWAGFDAIKIVGDDGVNTPAFTDVAPASAPASGTPTITQVNGGSALDINDYSNWTSNSSTQGAWGVYEVNLANQSSNQDADVWLSNANGGCFTLGEMDQLSGGAVNLSMTYDSPFYDTERDITTGTIGSSWTITTGSPTVSAYSPGTADPCFATTRQTTVTNSTTTASRITQKTAERESFVAGDRITADYIFKAGSTTSVTAKIVCDGANEVVVTGTLGSMPPLPTIVDSAIGNVETASVIERVSGDKHLIEMSITATNTRTCGLSAGPGVATNGASIHLINGRMWKNRTPHVMTYQTSLNKPDTTAPVIADCAFTGNTDGTGNVGCTVSEAATVYTVVTTSTTEPTDTQVIAGQNDAGTQAMWSGSVQGSAGVLQLTTGRLDSAVDKYAYSVAVDSAGLKSAVLPGDAPVLATLVGVKKLKIGTPTNKIRTRNAFGIMSDATVQLDRVYVYDTDISSLTTTTPVEPLVILQSVQITDGVGDATEAKVVAGSGSLNSLADGSYYVLTVVGSGASMQLSYGQKSVVTE